MIIPSIAAFFPHYATKITSTPSSPSSVGSWEVAKGDAYSCSSSSSSASSSPPNVTSWEIAKNHPYGYSSLSSSASSSSSSIFSSGSSISSVASSVEVPECDFLNEVKTVETYIQEAKVENDSTEINAKHALELQKQALQLQPLAPTQLRNPRRTNRLLSADTSVTSQPSDDSGLSTIERKSTLPALPPPLLRQNERKGNFVDSLVDTSAQIVETIWCIPDQPKTEGTFCKVLPLRTFIQETLRRSRTSYSTLQVALYYLILIKPFIQPSNSQTSSDKALHCGRRMFLASLILASKYLQDRNYSARAWSKISGLNTSEINSNEMLFLMMIDWKLHISETVFEKWTNLVLNHTPSMVMGSGPDQIRRKEEWSRLILRLTPSLEGVNADDFVLPQNSASENAVSPQVFTAPQSCLTSALLSTPRIIRPCVSRSPSSLESMMVSGQLSSQPLSRQVSYKNPKLRKCVTPAASTQSLLEEQDETLRGRKRCHSDLTTTINSGLAVSEQRSSSSFTSDMTPALQMCHMSTPQDRVVLHQAVPQHMAGFARKRPCCAIEDKSASAMENTVLLTQLLQ